MIHAAMVVVCVLGACSKSGTSGAAVGSGKPESGSVVEPEANPVAALADAARLAYKINGAIVTGKAGPTPSAACCSQPGKRCTPTSAEWADPTWKALEFTQLKPTGYQLSYASDGTWYEARATGDPSCDGNPIAYVAIAQPGASELYESSFVEPAGTCTDASPTMLAAAKRPVVSGLELDGGGALPIGKHGALVVVSAQHGLSGEAALQALGVEAVLAPQLTQKSYEKFIKLEGPFNRNDRGPFVHRGGFLVDPDGSVRVNLSVPDDVSDKSFVDCIRRVLALP